MPFPFLSFLTHCLSLLSSPPSMIQSVFFASCPVILSALIYISLLHHTGQDSLDMINSFRSTFYFLPDTPACWCTFCFGFPAVHLFGLFAMHFCQACLSFFFTPFHTHTHTPFLFTFSFSTFTHFLPYTPLFLFLFILLPLFYHHLPLFDILILYTIFFITFSLSFHFHHTPFYFYYTGSINPSQLSL